MQHGVSPKVKSWTPAKFLEPSFGPHLLYDYFRTYSNYGDRPNLCSIFETFQKDLVYVYCSFRLLGF